MTLDVADTELKTKHRAMWGKGDYPLMVDTFLLPIGQRLADACGDQPRRTRARRGGRHGQCVHSGRPARRPRDGQRPDARAAGSGREAPRG